MKNSTKTHERLAEETAPAAGSDRAFGVVFAILFAAIGLWPLLSGAVPALWGLVPSAGFLAAAILRPAILAPLNRVWTRFGLLIHGVVTPVLMAIVFFTTLVPIGLLLRAAGKNPLPLRPDRQAETYWIERDPPGPAPESMINQF